MNRMAFTSTLQTLLLSAAFSLAHAQCAQNDDACWGARALKFTNGYRRQSGRSALLSAPAPLHRNARRHSGAMARRNALFHQDLETVRAGCGLSLCAENVAMHHDVDGDRAAMCVQLWIESPPHRENMLGDAHSMAFAVVERDSRVWCTQTFARVDDAAASRKCYDGQAMGRRKKRKGQKMVHTAVPVPDEEGDYDDDGKDEVLAEEPKKRKGRAEKEAPGKGERRTSISHVRGSRGQKCYKICIKE